MARGNFTLQWGNTQGFFTYKLGGHWWEDDMIGGLLYKCFRQIITVLYFSLSVLWFIIKDEVYTDLYSSMADYVGVCLPCICSTIQCSSYPLCNCLKTNNHHIPVYIISIDK